MADKILKAYFPMAIVFVFEIFIFELLVILKSRGA